MWEEDEQDIYQNDGITEADEVEEDYENEAVIQMLSAAAAKKYSPSKSPAVLLPSVAKGPSKTQVFTARSAASRFTQPQTADHARLTEDVDDSEEDEEEDEYQELDEEDMEALAANKLKLGNRQIRRRIIIGFPTLHVFSSNRRASLCCFVDIEWNR